MQKLKWYDWHDIENIDLPYGFKGVKLRCGEVDCSILHFYFSRDAWKHKQEPTDIIAYTLGEPLEGDKK